MISDKHHAKVWHSGHIHDIIDCQPLIPCVTKGGCVVDQVPCLRYAEAVIASDVGNGGGCHAGEIDELISAGTNNMTELLSRR